MYLGFMLAGCSPQAVSTETEPLIAPWIGFLDHIPDLTSTPALERTPLATIPAQPILGTPTPDPVREMPPLRTQEEWYFVQPGESLNGIAGKFGVSAQIIQRANGISNPDLVGIGQQLLIPAQIPAAPGTSLKLIPDSELVYGPASVYFDLYADISSRGGYLLGYSEEVDGQVRSGAAIVQLVAERYSVNPRLLLALLDSQSGWLTEPSPAGPAPLYPLGYQASGWEGLFSQLSWAADQLNLGYYRWRAGWAGPYLLADGAIIPPGSGINAGTAAIQTFFAQLLDSSSWREQVGENGFVRTLNDLYGDPFARRVEPIVPPDSEQPELQLPFEPGSTWSFTGGPHSAWGDWAGWAALDFAPPGFAFGCVLSDAWAVAAADGVVVRAEMGEVILDLDRDGYEQTGWVLLYMHVESRDRVAAGSVIRAGDHIGHPSCEGGVTTGTHLHLARKYNGEWIPADGERPFVLDGWVSEGAGWPYDGYLRRGDVVLEACACRNDENQITR